MFLASPLRAETLPPLPPTLDDARMGVGDMYPLAVRGDVAFRICVIQDSPTSVKPPASGDHPSLDRRALKQFTLELNKRLRYLSGGRFRLRLRQIRFVSVPSQTSLADLENCVIAATAGQSFAMIIGPQYDGGSYIGRGVFKIAADEVASRPFNRKALHEILHALISPAHSTSSQSTLEQYNPVVGLAPEEAAFLGWPVRPALSPDSPVFDDHG